MYIELLVAYVSLKIRGKYISSVLVSFPDAKDGKMLRKKRVYFFEIGIRMCKNTKHEEVKSWILFGTRRIQFLVLLETGRLATMKLL